MNANWFKNRIVGILSKPSIDEIAAYQHKMPRDIRVDILYDEKTKYWTAKVIKIDNQKIKDLIITESKSEHGLVKMVNDALLTYLDFPEYMKSSMPSLLPEDISFDKKVSKNHNLVFAK